MKRKRNVMVINLDTGEMLLYMGISPKRAVALAYLQRELRNHNWWNPLPEDLPLVEGKRTWSCGNWSALK